MAGSNAASEPTRNFFAKVIPPDFGTILEEERAARGWSKARLAREAGLRRETIVHLEAGRRKPIPDTVFRLEAALDLLAGTLVPDWPRWQPIGSTTLGARSRERRVGLGLSLDEVAKASGVGASTISRFEREVGASWRLALIEKLEEGMVEVIGLVSDDYARALGFADADAHERWCRRD